MFQRGEVPWMLLLMCLLGNQRSIAEAFFEWLKKAAPTPASMPPASATASSVLHGEVPSFEMSVADEKFLSVAKQMDLSPLDSCHLKVITQLKATCNGLTEEQLAKLGVALFNCQSEVEGRGTYLCTEEMSIKECTADMDSDTWNAYHIVSNRARAVCYATRQQHFRRQAELTVNALISTATSQLDAMKDLKEGQRELRDLTASSLDRLLDGHSTLQLQQGALKEGQEQLDASITTNLQRLAQERALISTGQQLVAQLIQGITQRMENVSEQLKGQGTDVQEGHRAILDDLAEVRGRAQEIYSKMELSLNGVLQQQNTTVQFYGELIGKLERMNTTLGYLLTHLDSMQNRIEDRLSMIQGYLGWAGLSLHAVWTCVMHAGYFLFAAVLLSFLQCPTFSRMSLLITVPVNAIAEVNQQSALDLVTLSLLLVTLSLGHWFVLRLLWMLSKLKSQKCCPAPLPLAPAMETHEQPPDTACGPVMSSTPREADLECDLESEVPYLGQDSFMTGDPCMVALSPSGAVPPRHGRISLGTPSHSTPRLKTRHGHGGVVLERVPQRHLGGVLDAVSQSLGASPSQSVISNRYDFSVVLICVQSCLKVLLTAAHYFLCMLDCADSPSNSSLSGRPLCSGTTRLGQPCKKRALAGQDFCRVHEGGHNSYSRITN
ncbi:protein brambleberry isoform X2 [Electrophorus electricus]|uniref:protein brambleberry isoform X2 n=1 Tax=Electrophorus electricus TaxID=8005 RepID=UPI0015D049C1|nr:protein brambleberry isoform X2 [Electrophorus electricus]